MLWQKELGQPDSLLGKFGVLLILHEREGQMCRAEEPGVREESTTCLEAEEKPSSTQPLAFFKW